MAFLKVANNMILILKGEGGGGDKASKNGNALQNCTSLDVKLFHCSCIQ